jgi:hypothetical protein
VLEFAAAVLLVVGEERQHAAVFDPLLDRVAVGDADVIRFAVEQMM